MMNVGEDSQAPTLNHITPTPTPILHAHYLVYVAICGLLWPFRV